MAYPYRPYKKVFTYEEVCEMCRNTDLSKMTQASPVMISHFRPAFTDFFVGKEFTFHFDHGVTLHYRFTGKHNLKWSEDGEHFLEETYEALQSTVQKVFLVHHIRRHTIPYEGLTLIIDTENQLISWVDLNFGTEDCDKNVRTDFYFGYYGEDKGTRHHYTEEMCGLILDWKYSDDFVIRHAYITHSLMTSPGEPTDNEEEYLFRKTLPATYLKIRDNLCTVTFVEDGGSAAMLLIDLKELRDVGGFYSMSETGQLYCYTIGAVAGRGTFGFTGEYSIGYGPEPGDPSA